MEIPTLAFSVPTIAPTQSSGDDCNHLLDLSAVGNQRAQAPDQQQHKGTGDPDHGLEHEERFWRVRLHVLVKHWQEFKHHGLDPSDGNWPVLLGLRVGK